MKSELFRTHMFGGYRKEDVDSYIEKLESEVARLEGELKNSSGGGQSAVPAEQLELEDFIFLGGEGETEEGVWEETARAAVSAPPQREAADVQAEIEGLKLELETEKAKCEQAVKLLQTAIYEKQKLSDEVEELRTTQQGFESDRDAIKEVLMNARVNAEVIMTKARREARMLLEDTHRQINEQKRETMLQLMGQLSENYSGLQASKYFLEEQVKNIESMERQISEIRNKMQGDFDIPINEA